MQIADSADSKTSQTTAGKAHGECIAFIQAGWHKDILDPAREAFLSRMLATGMLSGQIDCFDVPGAFEIPLFALEALPAPVHPFNAGKTAVTVQTHVDLPSPAYWNESDVPGGMPSRALSITA